MRVHSPTGITNNHKGTIKIDNYMKTGVCIVVYVLRAGLWELGGKDLVLKSFRN